MSKEWVLRLTDGTILCGSVEDEKAEVIELRNPQQLQHKHSFTELNKKNIDIHWYVDSSVIYVERSAIAYWGKAKSNLR